MNCVPSAGNKILLTYLLTYLARLGDIYRYVQDGDVSADRASVKLFCSLTLLFPMISY